MADKTENVSENLCLERHGEVLRLLMALDTDIREIKKKLFEGNGESLAIQISKNTDFREEQVELRRSLIKRFTWALIIIVLMMGANLFI